MPPLTRRYNQGLVTSRDRSELRDGEMQQATGIYYKPGDQRAHKLDGRSAFGTVEASQKVQGVYLAEFDTATDQLLALANGTLYKSSATSGSFSDTTATVTGTTLSGAHANDRHFLCTGSENLVFESDGTVLGHIGMYPPTEGLGFSVATTQGGFFYPTTDSGAGLSDDAKAYDADDQTYAWYAAESSGGGSSAITFGTWQTNTSATERRLSIVWSFSSSLGSGQPKFPLGDDEGTSGGGQGLQFALKFEVSGDNGSSWRTFYNSTLDHSIPRTTTSTDVDGDGSGSGYDLSGNLLFKVTHNYSSGTNLIGFRIYEIRCEVGSPGTSFDITNILYGITEYDQTRDWESNIDEQGILETGAQTSMFSAVLTLPTTQNNTTTTHYKIYKTADNGTPNQLTHVATVPIADTTWTDTFQDYPATVQPAGNPRPQLRIAAGGTVSYYDRNGTPPALKRLEYYGGTLVGISAQDPRQLHYSIPGEPQYWPSIFVITSFPLKRNDTLVDVKAISGSLIIAANEAMIRMDSLPYSVQDTFIASNVVEISGAPGCVGPYAMCTVNHLGMSHVAWISDQDGVLVTDGHNWDMITRDIDWSVYDGFDKSAWVLRWVPSIRAVAMYYSSTSGGGNDRYLLFHLDSSHIKITERGVTDRASVEKNAKVTGPHYGAVADMTSGVVNNTFRVFEGHWSDGKVYLNLDSTTGADASQAYSSTTLPLIVQGGRSYGEWNAFSVVDGRLRHTDFGTGETCTMAVSMGRDEGDGTSSRSKTVSLASQRGTQYEISLHGEWFEETITHTGTGSGALQDNTLRVLPAGAEGTQKVV